MDVDSILALHERCTADPPCTCRSITEHLLASEVRKLRERNGRLDEVLRDIDSVALFEDSLQERVDAALR